MNESKKCYTKLKESMRKNLVIWSLFWTCILLGPAGRVEAVNWLEPYNVYNPRAMAMGNAFRAIADDEYALFSNPAGLMSNPKFGQKKHKGIISSVEIGLKKNSDLNEFRDFYKENRNSLKDPSQLSPETINSVLGKKAGIGMQGPINMGYVGNGWGVAVVNSAQANGTIGREAPLPLVRIKATAFLTIVGGFAFPVSLVKKNDFWIGGALKIFTRGDFDEEISLFDIQQAEDLKKNLAFRDGAGIDVGIIHRLNKNVDISVSGQDIPSVAIKSKLKPVLDKALGGVKDADTRFIRPNLAIGIAYRPQIKFMRKYLPEWIIDSPVLSFELSNLFDDNYSILTRTHFGLEFASLFHRVYIRAGLNQGYATYGLGFDLYFLRIDYVRYRKELGVFPGDLVEESDYFTITGKF